MWLKSSTDTSISNIKTDRLLEQSAWSFPEIKHCLVWLSGPILIPISCQLSFKNSSAKLQVQNSKCNQRMMYFLVAMALSRKWQSALRQLCFFLFNFLRVCIFPVLIGLFNAALCAMTHTKGSFRKCFTASPLQLSRSQACQASKNSTKAEEPNSTDTLSLMVSLTESIPLYWENQTKGNHSHTTMVLFHSRSIPLPMSSTLLSMKSVSSQGV